MDINEAIEKFVVNIQAMLDEHRSKNFPALKRYIVERDPNGKRYARITTSDGIGKSVYCFIDMTDGSIYKSASWKAPEKNFSRGNVLMEDALSWCGPYGIMRASR